GRGGGVPGLRPRRRRRAWPGRRRSRHPDLPQLARLDARLRGDVAGDRRARAALPPAPGQAEGAPVTSGGAAKRTAGAAAALVGRAGGAGRRGLERRLGRAQRTRVVVLLASVLALGSADASTVGASATQLRHALHINNTDIGLLVSVSSLVAAAASVPFGVLADRVNRTRTLGIAIVLWGVAMIWSATV